MYSSDIYDIALTFKLILVYRIVTLFSRRISYNIKGFILKYHFIVNTRFFDTKHILETAHFSVNIFLVLLQKYFSLHWSYERHGATTPKIIISFFFSSTSITSLFALIYQCYGHHKKSHKKFTASAITLFSYVLTL